MASGLPSCVCQKKGMVGNILVRPIFSVRLTLHYRHAVLLGGTADPLIPSTRCQQSGRESNHMVLTLGITTSPW